MPTDAQISVMRRMVRPARPSTGSMTDARAWRLSVPRASEKAVGLVAAVDGFETDSTDLDAILAGWEEKALSLGLEGPDGARGLVVLDTQLLAALIEVQALGRVTNRQVAPRPGTAVDAALAGHVIDAWIAAYNRAMGPQHRGAWAHKRMIPNARAAKMALDDGGYDAQTVTFSLGDGARLGQMTLYFPDGVTAPALAGPGGGAGDAREKLLNVRAELRAVLCRTTVPLAWLRAAKPGAVLHVPRAALGQVQIETGDGRPIARARLGRVGAHKALRMDPDEAGAASAMSGDWQDDGAERGLRPAADPLALAGGTEPLGMGDLPQIGELPDLPDLPDLPIVD